METPLVLAQSALEGGLPDLVPIRYVPACDFLDTNCRSRIGKAPPVVETPAPAAAPDPPAAVQTPSPAVRDPSDPPAAVQTPSPALRDPSDPTPLVPPPETTGSGPAPLQPGPADRRIQPPSRFDRSLDALVRDGVVSPREVRVHTGLITNPALLQQGCSSGAFSARECGAGDGGVIFRGLHSRGSYGSNSPSGVFAPPPPPARQSASEQSLPKSPAAIRDHLEYLRQEEDKLRALAEERKRAESDRLRLAEERKWRQYGGITVKWDEWKLAGNGIRITRYAITKEPGSQLHPPSSMGGVAISCSSLKISYRSAVGDWGEWSLPAAGSEDEKLIIDLCSNIRT